MKDAYDILTKAGETFTERAGLYGDNYLRIGPVMEALFPAGLVLKNSKDWNAFHLFFLNIVKQTRVAVSFERTGEMHLDSVHDQVTYNAMLEAFLTNEKEVKEEKQDDATS